MKKLVLNFFQDLKLNSIKYCHFKSNNTLHEAVDGIGDLDLLVSIDDYDSFNSLLAKHKFRLAHDIKGINSPFVVHYYSVDFDTGEFIHLHVYYKLITGGALFKNYWIPLEKMMLNESSFAAEYQTFIPSKEADLILFVIRKMLEQPSIVEQYLLFKDRVNVRKELDWLTNQADMEILKKILSEWIPFFSFELFESCLKTIKKANHFNLLSNIYLGRKIRKLFPNKVMPEWYASICRTKLFLLAFISARLKITKKNRVFQPGGGIVAFVGSEGSGKSTLSTELYKWISKEFFASHFHLGKPNKVLATKVAWLFISLASKLKKINSKKITQNSNNNNIRGINVPHPLVAFLDAIDRFYAASKCADIMIKGGIVITDRYPTIGIGGIDGPSINNSTFWGKILGKIEKKLYAINAQPTLVFKVQAPLEITLDRNSKRVSPEPEDFVKHRYEQAKNIYFPSSKVVEITTTDSLKYSLNKVKQIFWESR